MLKKKAAAHSGTPEHSVRDTPTDSRSSMGQGEGPSEQSTVDAVLRGEDVQALLVTEENLKKVCYCDAMLTVVHRKVLRS